MRLAQIILILVLLTSSLRAQDSLNFTSLFHWKDTSLVPSSAHKNEYNEVWGYAKQGREYAIVGTTAGTHIFDVTVPDSSEQVAFIVPAKVGSGVVHRDYDTYEDHLFIVCDEGASTLQVADLSFLPDSAPVVFDSDTFFQRSHNIFIDTLTATMWSCGGNGNQLSMYDISTPSDPQKVLSAGDDVAWWASGPGYIHDVFARNDTVYCNAGLDGFYVADFSDTANVTLLGSLTEYPESGYNHSGWLHPTKPIYAMADETHGKKIKIMDVSDLGDITVTDLINSGVHTYFSIPHNLIFTDDLLHVSHYHDGYYCFDVSNPDSAFVVGYYDTSIQGHTNNYRGCWGIYPFLPSGNILVTDMQEGLFVLSYAPEPIDSIDSTPPPADEILPIGIYPNPFNTSILVSLSEFKDSLDRYEFYNAKGQLIKQGSLINENFVIQLNPSLASGVYTLRIFNDRYAIRKKLVKGM